MNNLIKPRISQIIKSKEAFQNDQTIANAKPLLIDGLEIVDLILKELLAHFRTISSSNVFNANDLQLLIKNSTDIETKLEELIKLKNWLRNKDDVIEDVDGKKRKSVLKRIGFIVISMHTLIIESKSKIDYEIKSLSSDKLLSQSDNQTVSNNQNYPNLFFSIFQWFLNFITFGYASSNKAPTPDALTLATNKPVIESTDLFSNQFVNVINDPKELKVKCDQMNLCVGKFEQLMTIVNDVREWAENNVV